MNRLSAEKSPYLLQHAGNPVDWYPWGDEALRRARNADRPLFISIGYATCHWCHVMERESFEDAEVAALMNRAFVCVKVDREERPDLDEQYMTACTLLTGGGGWPLTILATPDGRPFFAATYLPRRTLVDLVPRVEEAWSHRRDEVERSAAGVLDALRQAVAESGSRGIPGAGAIERAAAALGADFDERHGGFGGAPKFPTPHTLSFLLRCNVRSGDARALHMAERTLVAMRRGGIYDHVGFGFHRYSTDERWLVPHFEKMLCDQALLVVAYLEAYQATGRELFARTAREVLEYVERDLGLPEGAFASAEDADSEGEEGKFYLWGREELGRVLGPPDLALLERVAGLAPGSGGGSILHLADDAAEAIPEGIRVRLAEARSRRVRPLRDDKILADWNGLAVAAFARAARVLDEPRYAAVAARVAAFVLTTMRDPEGNLLHRYRQGEASIPGYASDYAYLVWGLLELYEAAFAAEHLRRAVELADALIARFVAPATGGGSILSLTDRAGEPLLVRPRAATDGALPSPLSVAVSSLLRIARMTGRSDLEEAARDLLAPLVRPVEEHPRAFTAALAAVDFLHGPTREVVIAGPPGAATRELLAVVSRRFLPGGYSRFWWM